MSEYLQDRHHSNRRKVDGGQFTRIVTVTNKICGFYSVIGAQMEQHWIHKYGNTL